MSKQILNFFPHFVHKGKTLTVLESKYGSTGYAFWFKLLEILCEAEGHTYSCADPTNLSYLAIYALTDDKTAVEILDLLADMGKIDTQLWRDKKAIWCPKLVEWLKYITST